MNSEDLAALLSQRTNVVGINHIHSEDLQVGLLSFVWQYLTLTLQQGDALLMQSPDTTIIPPAPLPGGDLPPTPFPHQYAPSLQIEQSLLPQRVVEISRHPSLLLDGDNNEIPHNEFMVILLSRYSTHNFPEMPYSPGPLHQKPTLQKCSLLV